MAVVDSTGAIVGEVAPRAVIDLLSGKERGWHERRDAASFGSQVAAPSLARWIVPGAILAAVLIFILRDQLPVLSSYPTELVIPFKEWIAATMSWLKVNFTWFTRSLTAIIDVPLRFAFNLLAKGFKFRKR